MTVSKIMVFLVALFLSVGVLAQDKKPDQNPKDSAMVKSDTTKPKKPEKKPKEPKPYDKVITDSAVTSTGFFKVHKVDDKYYFEIPDSMWNREILVVNRISRAAAGQRVGMMGYGGDQIGQNVIEFTQGPDDNVFLRKISFQEQSTDSSADGMYRSFENSNLHPLEAAFPVAAYTKDKKGAVIDVTKYVDGDNDILFFNAGLSKMFGLSRLQSDRSYIMGIKAFPKNLEIRTFKTFMKTSSPRTGGSPGPAIAVSYELNSSMVLLPKVPMKARLFDPRVGYFATTTVDFDLNPQGVEKVVKAVRWRMEPKKEDEAKYLRGKLVEPRKQLVYYIDPATPKKWVPYLIQGVDDWQVAFEAAGFKNAIVAKVAPTGDSIWSLDDARHSAIVYKSSAVANASGPNVHDPRSGEILETHVNWYHNVMNLVRDWYLIQASAVDPRARTMMFSDELMGQLIRFVSSHEVGHTLGLRHNFGSSSTVPVEKLRDKKWLAKHGHTPSIMDYARFNYVAQPGDDVGDAGMYPHIGEYDKWAIEWGYKWLPQFKTAEDESTYLNNLTTKKLAENPRLFFGTESDPNDPRDQSEQVGDDAMIASTYGIKNLKRILPNIMDWTKEKNKGYSNADEIYTQLVSQFSRYMGHVKKYIGGIETTPSYVEQKAPVYAFTKKASQQEAMTFLQKQLFTTPTWLLDKKLFAFIGPDNVNVISALQSSTLNTLLSTRTLGKLVEFEMYNPSDAYTPTEMLKELKTGIWSELGTHQPIDIYRRNLQKIYVDRLVDLVKPKKPEANQMMMRGRGSSGPDVQNSDIMSVLKGHIRGLIDDIEKALPAETDNATKLHLEDVLGRLKKGLDPKDED